ncbi:MAG: hypothetical protein ACI9GE_001030 [Oceanospirillaceae bacterium]|jgi:hypothetical protein
MTYQLAQLNIARFKLPQDHPANADFVNNLDRINAIAEQQPGFIWRFTGAGNNAMDVQAFDDPHVAANMSVWADLKVLKGFVYNDEAHKNIMRRRKEWFDKMEFYMVLWWVKAGHIPSLEEAKQRLVLLQEEGPSSRAFSFRNEFKMPL